MKTIAKGDLFRRITLNRQRLSSPMYRYPEVFSQNSSWPGDWEGRCILGLTCLFHAFRGYKKERHSILSQLREIFDHLPEFLNMDGYFGEPVDLTAINEQQVSGNSWFIRGLVEYYRIEHKPELLDLIRRVAERFLLPISFAYSHYPLVKRDLGGVGGHIEGTVTDGWLTSSDIGCAFIALDAMSEVYDLLLDPRLEEAIRRVIDSFVAIDFVSLQCQTHATLSCARGVLKFYERTKEKRYLEIAKGIFETYLQQGMTLDYSNKNWFGRPETWTEPCCIVDSYILAAKLYEILGGQHYLTLANRIYWNAFRSAQRHNGGAGCNTCLTSDQTSMKAFLFEAYFCCSMRLGEGLRATVDYAGEYNRTGLHIHLLHEAVYELHSSGYLEVRGDLYKKGPVKFIVRNLVAPVWVHVYIPSSLPFVLDGAEYTYENEILTFQVKKRKTIRLYPKPVSHAEGERNFVGDMLLVKRNPLKGEEPILIHETPYYYLLDYSRLPNQEEAMEWKQEI